MISLPKDDGYQFLSHNVLRVMAREKLTFVAVCEGSGLDERTVRAIARGRVRPQSRTVSKLAEGLGVTADELFRPLNRLPQIAFDRATNLFVEQVVNKHPESFEGWSDGEFDELYSRTGVGGSLTEEGVLAAAAMMNRCRELVQMLRVVLESPRGPIMADVVTMMYENATTPRGSVNGVASAVS